MRQKSLLGLVLILAASLLGGCYYSSSGCFVAGTRIAVPGGEKNIEDIKVGDKVTSYDFETSTFVEGTVVETHVHDFDEQLLTMKVGDADIHVTPDHPLRTEGKGWVRAADIQEGDELLTISSEELVSHAAESITHSKNAQKVYNIEVRATQSYENSANYFANGVLARYY